MSEIAIEARDLGKLYVSAGRGDRSMLNQLLSAVGLRNGSPEGRWALRHVDLKVGKGQCLGVIGPNGSGKTTLLTMLAGLLGPTEGSVRVNGRISPFLQLDSGLHSDLPVIDNLRLTAALFGMSERQFRQRFDAIVDFGGLEPYLDMLLGELSSGYAARVPFVAALHADIDIMLIDEIFAVGDLLFSNKCLKRMNDLRREGKTMVLASHQLDLVRHYCSQTLYLNAGAMVRAGDSSDVVKAYSSRRD